MCQKYKKLDWKCVENSLQIVWSVEIHDLIEENALQIECFHVMSRWPYWCPKTMKRRPCWCPKPVLWELNFFLMQTLSFVPVNLHRCWPCEWKHSIAPYNLCEQTDSLNNVYWKYGFQLKLSNLATFSAFSKYRLNCNCKFY